jgi:hypothetical protein
LMLVNKYHELIGKHKKFQMNIPPISLTSL